MSTPGFFGVHRGKLWFTARNAFRSLREESAARTSRVWTSSDRLFSWMLRHLPFIRPDHARIRSDEYPIRLWTVAVFLFGALPASNPTNEGMMDVTVEHLFGNIWSREGLALRDRSMITVAALTVLGREPQLKVHLKGARRLGISREELKEMMSGD